MSIIIGSLILAKKWRTSNLNVYLYLYLYRTTIFAPLCNPLFGTLPNEFGWNFFNRIGLGKLTYLGVALKQLMGARYITGELTLNNGENIIPLNKLLFITGMNHKYEGGGFKFGPEANNHDGMLEICAVTRISKLKILFSLPKAYNGSHFEVDGIDHYRVRSYTVRVSEPLYVHADGEVDAKADFISVYLDQEALHMIY